MSTHPARRLVAAAIAAATLPLVGCDAGRSADLDPGPSTTQAPDRDAAAAETLEDLERAIGDSDRAAATELAAGSGAQRELLRAVGNARRLDLRSVTLRTISDSQTSLTSRQQERWGGDAWVVDVQVTWRYGGVDQAPAVLTVPVAMTLQDGQARILSSDLAQAERVPLWLTDQVRVARGPGVMAVTTDARRPGQVLGFARSAARTVRTSLPSWRGVLCVEVPANQGSFRDVAGVPQQQAAAIAAVTTTQDGTTTDDATQHVYLNPRLFDPLEAEGQQIVLSHEAAHVALGAPMLELPIWLSEGIADYVALALSTTSVDTLAAQILELTREDGAPRRLPGPRQFDGSDDRIGAWYEAAWLAVKLIADTYGEDTMWRFYREAVRGGGTTTAFREVLDVDQREFVRQWRSYLTALAQ